MYFNYFSNELLVLEEMQGAGTLLILEFPIAVIVQARSTFVKSEAMLGIVETEDRLEDIS